MRIRINRAKDRVEIELEGGDSPLPDNDGDPEPVETLKFDTGEGKEQGRIEVDADGYVRRILIPGMLAAIGAVGKGAKI
jgi:hypothetical protein